MKEKYKQYQKSIKKVHRFGFWKDLCYEEILDVPVKKYLFLPLAKKVVELLEWELLLLQDYTIFARSKESWGTHGKVKIEFLEYSRIKISSTSALDERWDNGKNSVRVKLFIKVFFEELEKLSIDEKIELEKNFQKEYNWDDYEIPDSLPEPPVKQTVLLIPYLGSAISVITLGIFAGFVDYKVIEGVDQFRLFNIPIISEAILATIFWFAITRLARLGNFIDLGKLKAISIISLVAFFLTSEITFYWLLKYPWLSVIDFFIFIGNYYEPYFTRQDIILLILNSGVILLSILMICFTFWIRLIAYISRLSYERVPTEVVDFVYYLHSKNKTENEIRYELSKRGWESKQNQDDAFDALGGLFQVNEFAKF
ncbi:MAG: hypothetical protein F6K19_11460 [Cyanothece sp. SIO1E1]|nr:hypothetical protein [Cyanothece sp. SIO1E1]